MSTKHSLNPLWSFIFLLCFYCGNAQELVKNVEVDSESATFQMQKNTPQSLLIEIAGPDDYYFKEEVEVTSDIVISNKQATGEVFPDGQYKLQVTPIIRIENGLLEQLVEMRNQRDALGIQKFREKHGLPEEVISYNYNYSIKKGKFVYSNLNENAISMDRKMEELGIEHPELYASVNIVEMGSPLNLYEDKSAYFDQVFFDDVIVVGSICVGQDCVNGESFGFDTGRYKENNLRVHFDDTSNSASFPKNDWRITINDSSNGGASYFAVEDVTGGRVPFRIIAGAPANALYVDAQGDVGIGTASPVVEVHVNDGDTPTMRLQQDGSAGFGQQTWDVAGNETNFFVRDVTNGSKLSFKIKPGAPDNSLFVAANGDIGLGTQNPTEGLQVESGNVYVKAGNVGVNRAPSSFAMDVLGTSQFEGTTLFKGDVSYFLSTGTSFLTPTFMTTLRVDASNNRVGIGTATPGHLLELSADDAAKPNGGTWTAASDRRLKQNIKTYTGGLDELLKINPVTYNYNSKSGYDTNKEHVGIIAQDIQKIAPYMIRKLNPEKNDYLAFEGTALTFMLVNAVKDQQKIINSQKEEIAALSTQVNELAQLKEIVASLAQQVASLEENSTSGQAVQIQNSERQ